MWPNECISMPNVISGLEDNSYWLKFFGPKPDDVKVCTHSVILILVTSLGLTSHDLWVYIQLHSGFPRMFGQHENVKCILILCLIIGGSKLKSNKLFNMLAIWGKKVTSKPRTCIAIWAICVNDINVWSMSCSLLRAGGIWAWLNQ